MKISHFYSELDKEHYEINFKILPNKDKFAKRYLKFRIGKSQENRVKSNKIEKHMTKHHLTTFFRNFNKAIRTFTHSDNWLIAVLQNSVKPHQQKHSGARVWVWLCWETSKADKNSNMSDKQFLEYWRSLKVSVRIQNGSCYDPLSVAPIEN